MKNLPDGVDLILNGDTVDRRRKRLTEIDHEALGLISRESMRRRVIWIWGNHDWKYLPPEVGKIEFARDYSFGRQLFLGHGHQFDFIMPFTRPVIIVIRMLHDLRVDRGGRHVHVAFAAKRFVGLYRFLRHHVTKRAVRYGVKHGYKAVACGHTHYVEDRMVDGVRYLNTGAWTEAPNYCLWVSGEGVSLIDVEQLADRMRVL